MRISKSFSARLSATILLVTSILFITAIMVVSYYSHKLIAEEAIKSASNVLYTTTIDINKTLDSGLSKNILMTPPIFTTSQRKL